MTWTSLDNTSSPAASTKKVLDGYNLLEGLRSFRNAVADVDVNPVKIGAVGDSVTLGSGTTDYRLKSWVGRLRTALQAKFGDVGLGTCHIPQAANIPESAPWWTLAGTWGFGIGNSIAGRFMKASGSGNTATLTFTGTSIDLIYAKLTTGASSGVSITIDGSAVAAPNFNVASNQYSNVQSYTGLSAGSHTLVITGSDSGDVVVETVIAYNPIATTPKGCYLFNFGTGSTSSGTYSGRASQIASVAKAHLYIVALGINDSFAGTYNSATYLNNMNTLVSGLKASGASVLLLPYYMINGDSTQNANYQAIVQAQYDVADTNNCGLIDIYDRWGKSYALAQTAKLMAGATSNDAYHPSDKGYADIANAIFNRLLG